MTFHTWYFGWLDYPNIGYYTSYAQEEDYWHVYTVWLLFKVKLTKKANTKGISVTQVTTIQVQPEYLPLLIQQILQFSTLCIPYNIPYIVVLIINWNFTSENDLIKVQRWYLSHYACLPLNASSIVLWNKTFLFRG